MSDPTPLQYLEAIEATFMARCPEHDKAAWRVDFDALRAVLAKPAGPDYAEIERQTANIRAAARLGWERGAAHAASPAVESAPAASGWRCCPECNGDKRDDKGAPCTRCTDLSGAPTGRIIDVPPSAPTADAGSVARPNDGVALIAAERKRQVEVKGWTPDHDDEHDRGEMACAAAAYAIPGGGDASAIKRDGLWPWDSEWWKPSPNDRVRELVKAGALIAAEIDRLVRVLDAEHASRRGGSPWAST